MNIKTVCSIGAAVVTGVFLAGLAVGALTHKKCACHEKDVKSKQVYGQGKTQPMPEEMRAYYNGRDFGEDSDNPFYSAGSPLFDEEAMDGSTVPQQ